MENAIYFRRPNFSNDEETILYVWGYVKNEAKNWFQDYQDKLQQRIEVLAIMSGIEVLNEWFISDNYITQAYNKPQNLEYNNSIENLVAKYRRLVTKAKLTGLALREPLICSLS